ncbi:MAG: adenylosuccinate synthase [Cyclobacteriaceae bacterium]|nr:adenylosuccinate synthase [Cyclobacteriaceae bacterium]
MKVDVILGLQWGDEGKGKIVDVLAPEYDVIARFQGGPNAGHTLEFDNIKHVLHQIPSGMFRKNTLNVIGNGVVLDPVIFKKEIEKLAPYGLDPRANLVVSTKAQLILPTHRLLDQAYEQSKGDNKIGSTLKGIGPAYQDKIARAGIRTGDILSKNFEEKLNQLMSKHLEILADYPLEYDFPTLKKEFSEAIDFLKSFKLVDTTYLINDKLQDGHKILAEGAQGSMLDIDFGSYPFVTSSNTTTPGVCTGLGVAPSKIGRVYGIFKAYCTRVGSGPFPTELFDEEGELIRSEGREYGATTGRPRRCGWIDIPALKYAIMINGVTDLIMMKADVLSIFDEIKVCTHYMFEDGTVSDRFPNDLCSEKIVPVYQTLKGWKTDLSSTTDEKKFPDELVQYIARLEELLSTPIVMVSLGPGRNQTIKRQLF